MEPLPTPPRSCPFVQPRRHPTCSSTQDKVANLFFLLCFLARLHLPHVTPEKVRAKFVLFTASFFFGLGHKPPIKLRFLALLIGRVRLTKNLQSPTPRSQTSCVLPSQSAEIQGESEEISIRGVAASVQFLVQVHAGDSPMQPDPSGNANANAKAKLPPLVTAPASGRPASVLPHKTANVRDHYRIGKKLGQGQFGTTYQCVAKADGGEYACKSIPKRKLLCREDYEDVWREIQIMHHLSEHPNVVRIRDAYEDALFVHIVMELCAGGELFDRIVAKGHYSERAAAQLIRTIVGVVEGCHSLGVMHRDLKPENFLFLSTTEDAPLKATDFGLSMFYKPGDKFSDVVGSPYYVAPEVLHKCYGPEADVWSAGVILYILLCGVPPFWAETEAGIFRQILRGKLDFESEPWPSISDSAKDLVHNMLNRDPKMRLTAYEVLCHPWIVDDAVAPDKPIDSAVLSRLKHFSAMNKLKKMALRVIAESLSEEEIGGLKELFKMIDTDNSGTITFDELKDGLERVGSELTEHEIQVLMEAADIDNSGTIDYGEFIAATLHMNKLEREENLVSAFSFFDKDGSGFITIDELSQSCREFGLVDVHLEDMIRDVDQNNDGQIDYNEFAAMMRKGNAGAAGRRTMRNSLHVNLGDILNPSTS